jgi:DNA polymerase
MPGAGGAMATRDEILRELGVAPRWRLRRAAAELARDDHGARPSDNAEPEDVDAPSARSVVPEDVDVRRARIAALDHGALVADIAACTACGLCRTRRKTVPGVGDDHARWLFIGEAPGADEDAQGEPFVGQAGRLLDNMLAALGLARGRDVYIANVLKCRPPGNRTPDALEVRACRPYLDRQIELIAPSVIVALGKSAASALLESDAPVGSLRKRVHRYHGIALVVTYHPAYLLRTPGDKAKAWEDLLFARRTLRDVVSDAMVPLA